MGERYPQLDYAQRVPSSIPSLWNGGWENETALKVYFELTAGAYGMKIDWSWDANQRSKVSRTDYQVILLQPGGKVKQVELKLDLRTFLQQCGDDDDDTYEGIRTDAWAHEPSEISWPSIIFAGTDQKGDREWLEENYPGEVIVVDEHQPKGDVPKGIPTFPQFRESLRRSFVHYEGIRHEFE